MMDTKENSIIEEIYYSFLKEKNQLIHAVQSNDQKIEELERTLSGIAADDTEMKFFSPRNRSLIEKQEIDNIKTELSLIKNDNIVKKEKIDVLSNQVKKLAELLENNSFDSSRVDMFDVQEKERQRIARELHDSTVQNLTHLVHSIELGSLYIDKDPIQAKLELQTCNENLKKCIDDIRDIIFDLRPMSFDDLGFAKCLQDYIQNLKLHYSSISFDYDMEEFVIKLTEQKQLVLFRIIQEAIQNAIKHSNTDKIELHMKHLKEEKCQISIIDFGNGFINCESEENHIGLSIMKERAKLIHAQLNIISELQCGTTIEIIFDLL